MFELKVGQRADDTNLSRYMGHISQSKHQTLDFDSFSFSHLNLNKEHQLFNELDLCGEILVLHSK